MKLMWLMFACTPKAPPEASTEATEDRADPLASAWLAALEDARYPLPSEVVSDLLVLDPAPEGVIENDRGEILMTTWTRAKFFSDPAYVQGYSFPLYGETWLTAGREVADACAGLSGPELSLRVEQLLGLAPGGGRDVFLSVYVPKSAIFRPCADPSIASGRCPIAAPLVAGDGDSVSWDCDSPDLGEHGRWMCATWTERYGASDPARQSPWTALGTTYDWGRPDDPRGPTEFVAPKGTIVTLESMQSNEQHCAR